MTKPKILLLARFLDTTEERLGAAFDLLYASPNTEHSLSAKDAEQIQGIATLAAFGVPNELIDSLPNLEIISSRGVGLDRIDVAYAQSKNISVLGTPDILNECVADLAWGLLISTLRGIVKADRFVRQGQWQQGAFPVQTRVHGKKLGMVGMGAIGQAIGRRAEAFNMEIAYYSRNENQDVAAKNYRYVPELIELARWADILLLIVPGGKATHALINQDVLTALGPRGYLINVARGSVVDQEALIIALQDAQIAGAGLDVFTDEPDVPQALIEMDNVVLLPHIGSGTQETRQAMERMVVEHLLTALKP